MDRSIHLDPLPNSVASVDCVGTVDKTSNNLNADGDRMFVHGHHPPNLNSPTATTKTVIRVYNVKVVIKQIILHNIIYKLARLQNVNVRISIHSPCQNDDSSRPFDGQSRHRGCLLLV